MNCLRFRISQRKSNLNASSTCTIFVRNCEVRRHSETDDCCKRDEKQSQDSAIIIQQLTRFVPSFAHLVHSSDCRRAERCVLQRI
ncbi:hypothetical protein VTN31DRAFT_7510 [Thermomyces dupontii]|uniref:uncharacterized protein n=1 Tax=Talaromyces thermophilus TaxID=28565 RepID=UPI003742061C